MLNQLRNIFSQLLKLKIRAGLCDFGFRFCDATGRFRFSKQRQFLFDAVKQIAIFGAHGAFRTHYADARGRIFPCANGLFVCIRSKNSRGGGFQRGIVRERFIGWTLLELDLVTGRTHQIRVHLEAIGHPVAGDPVYGTGTSRKGPRSTGDGPALERLFLHAWRLQLTSPSNGNLIRAEAPLPPELEGVLAGLRGAASDLSGPEGRR